LIKKVVGSFMLTNNIKLNIDDIISSLQNLDNSERAKLQNALFELQNDLDLKDAIQESLDDIKSGRVSSHEAVMKEINAKHNS
jgi:predicted transcriptional regulator